MRQALFVSFICLNVLLSQGQSQTKKDIMDSLRSEGQRLTNEDEFDQAIAVFFEAMEMAKEEGYTYKVAILLSEIGNANLRNKNGDAAIDFIRQARETILSMNDTTEKIRRIAGGINNNLGLAYHRLERYDEAIATYKSQFDGFLTGTYDSSMTYTNLGRTYAQMNLFDSALMMLDKGAPLREKIGSSNHHAFAYKEYATIYNELGDYTQSANYGKRVLDIGLENDHSGHIEDGYRNLRNTYYDWGKYKESAEYGQKYATFLQEMHDRERDEIITEMQTKYEVAQKDHEIEQLRFETIIAEKTKLTLIVITLSVIVVTFLIILYLRNSLKKQRVEKELTQAQLDLKHRELLKKQEQLDHFVEVIQEKNKVIDAFEQETNMATANKEEILPKLYESVILTEKDWEEFKEMFESVYENFFGKLKSSIPSITLSEMRLSALMKLNLTTKEISNTLGISPDSVTKTKYRIKKKLEMEDTRELHDFVMAIG